jgi:hypothetical protein
MATITATNMAGGGVKTLTEVALTGTADTFTYKKGGILLLKNDTGGAISPTITGAGVVVGIDGLGTVNTSSGYAVGSIAAGASKVIALDTIRLYITGTIAITAGTGLDCSVLDFV